VAGNEVFVVEVLIDWHLRFADFFGVPAAWVKVASLRWIDWAGDISLK